MADIVLNLFPIVEGALSRVVSLVTDEIILVWGLRKDLQKLKDSLGNIRYMLQYAEEQQVTQGAVKGWLEQLKDVAYGADDVLDEFHYHSLRQQVEAEVKNFLSFSNSSNYLKKLSFHQKMAHKIKYLRKSMEEIQKKGDGLGLIRAAVPQVRELPQTNSVPDRHTDSVLDNSNVVGRELDVSRIMNLLTCCCDQQALTFIPIVGMGGLGKTTLAKLVFKEAKEKNLFDETMWVCVHENFEIRLILKEMLETLDERTGGLCNMDAILKHLGRKLEGKKFLLILDDVWTENPEKWESLKSHLLAVSRSNGTVVVLTTRKAGVASIVETSSLHRHTLSFLQNEECWSIIKEKVIADGGTSIPSDLEAIGRDVAEKCRGVPLVAKVLGGTMNSNRDKKAWLSIRSSSVFNSLENEENFILPILKLSFDRLPSYLKPCFAYCSIFPKDHFIEKRRLIQLWMAEGLFDPSNEGVGDKYFNALLLNSFFEEVKTDKHDHIRGYKMHDLMHDLALSISKSKILIVESSSAVDISHIHHLNLIGNGKLIAMSPKNSAKKLRSLFIKDVVIPESWKLKSLRTLKLEGSNVTVLPSCIGKLKHLRYLDISKTEIEAFPKSIIKLLNLQTLRFLDCWSLEKVPEKISNLISLRHIEFSYRKQMPANLGHLTCLETLPLFAVGGDKGRGIEQLECLNRLGGEMRITNLEVVSGKKEAEKANLHQKTEIKALRLVWGAKRERVGSNDEEVLEGLQPHPKIKGIAIVYYLGEKLPSWLSMMKAPSHGDSFTLFDNLVKLKLLCFQRCGEIPRLGNLPRLKILQIIGVDKVRCIGNEFYGIDGQSSSTGWILFPALEVFCLGNMKSLVEWITPTIDGVTVFPCLEELSITNCRKLRMVPKTCGSSLVKLEIINCDKLSHLFDEVESFPSLRSLTIEGCLELTSLPNWLQSCMSLEDLTVRNLVGLTSVQECLQNLSSVVDLRIYDCPSLSYFRERMLHKLSGLNSLVIGGFSKELDDFSYLNSIKDLPSLQHLTICGRFDDGDISQLPHQLQGLTGLHSLCIQNFDGVEALPDWLGNLVSLRFLTIYCCKNVKYLPTTTALQRLSKLGNLEIYHCPILEESCHQGSGSEWHKISHIERVVKY